MWRSAEPVERWLASPAQAFSSQVRGLEAELRSADDAIEEREALLLRSKGAIEALSAELGRARGEAEVQRAQARAGARLAACPASPAPLRRAPRRRAARWTPTLRAWRR